VLEYYIVLQNSGPMPLRNLNITSTLSDFSCWPDINLPRLSTLDLITCTGLRNLTAGAATADSNHTVTLEAVNGPMDFLRKFERVVELPGVPEGWVLPLLTAYIHDMGCSWMATARELKYSRSVVECSKQASAKSKCAFVAARGRRSPQGMHEFPFVACDCAAQPGPCAEQVPGCLLSGTDHS
jgi:hypothetical protein